MHDSPERLLDLTTEIRETDVVLQDLVARTTPTMVSRLAISTGHAAPLLITAGQNIDRLHSEAAFARLCDVIPISVPSGKTQRMCLHRGGDRQVNATLHMIAVCRQGPTTIVIAHRLSQVRDADEILVFSDGRVVECGQFEDLVARRAGRFAGLWAASGGA